jgi:hypothetical protein
LLGPDHQFLIHDYPLTGTFEFSVDVYHGSWAEGHMGYAGLVFEPNPTSVSRLWPVGSQEQIPLPGSAMHRDSFNRFTVQVEPGKLRWLVNGRLVHELTDPSPTSPWLMLFASRERHTVFRNPQLRGTPQIPRDVHLSHGDCLEGWVCNFYNESRPPRLNNRRRMNKHPMNKYRAGSASRSRNAIGRLSTGMRARERFTGAMLETCRRAKAWTACCLTCGRCVPARSCATSSSIVPAK